MGTVEMDRALEADVEPEAGAADAATAGTVKVGTLGVVEEVAWACVAVDSGNAVGSTCAVVEI